MTRVYVLLSIGPVQGYIAQARRTQDLWFGSRLLSALALEALRNIPNYEQNIVYPLIEDWQHPPLSIPNRLMFTCPADKAKEIAHDIKTEVEKTWYQIAANTRTHLESRAYTTRNHPHPITIPDDIWRRQIENWLEVQYVIVPDTGNYAADHADAGRMLAARKLIRNFKQTHEAGFKCTITGQHEALHNQLPNNVSYQRVQAYWKDIQKRQRNLALISDGEQLCALSVVKRIAHEANAGLAPDDRFPSTSSIASARFRASIAKQWDVTREHVAKYLEALLELMHSVGRDWKDLYFHRGDELHPEHFPYILYRYDDEIFMCFMSLDGDFFYPDTLQPRTVATFARVDTPVLESSAGAKALDAARKAQAHFLKQMNKLGIPRPGSYLAILAMDGDKVGEYVHRFLTSRKEHADFSADLTRFAESVIYPQLEQEIPGRVVYAGGDDLLAVLPCTDVLNSADEIRRRFNTTFPGLTMSAGIAIVHRSYTLQGGVEAARKALARAKDGYGRDAFAIEFLKRSGEPQSGGIRWYEDIEVIPLLMQVMDAMKTKKLALQLPYEMDNLTYALVGQLDVQQAHNRGINISDEARNAEFKRVFKRRWMGDDKARDDLIKNLTTIARSASQRSQVIGQGWLDLQVLMRLARFLVQEGMGDVADD